MATQPLEKRVDVLEQRVRALDGLPAQVAQLTLKVSQLHREMQDGFSALRAEDAKLRQEMQKGFRALRAEDARLRKEMRGLHKTAMTRMDGLHAEAIARMDALHAEAMTEMHALHKQAMTEMRVLHEAVLARLALLGNGAGGTAGAPTAPGHGPKSGT